MYKAGVPGADLSDHLTCADHRILGNRQVVQTEIPLGLLSAMSCHAMASQQRSKLIVKLQGVVRLSGA